MKIALAQLNPVIGDMDGQLARMGDALDRAADAGADLVVFGELSVCGYPPRDLLLKSGFVEKNLQVVEALAQRCRGVAALVGHIRPNASGRGRALHNAAALLADGRVAGVHVKQLLPTYDVFDETRYFEPGAADQAPLEFQGLKLGLTICEDLWDDAALGRRLYRQDPPRLLADAGADLLINLSASPFQAGKQTLREELIARRAVELGRPIVYVNQVGGNDELIFDGASCCADAGGQIVARCKAFDEDLLVLELPLGAGGGAAPAARLAPVADEVDSIYRALVMGLRDYVHKCGFSKAVLGLSGGIDSALVAAIAADALGPANLTTIAMPSRYSSDHSRSDADLLADNLGCDHRTIAIEPMHAAFEAALAESFSGTAPGLAEENVQARARGVVVMAFSNKFGHLALATGNKSELSTGYCTLYGDMCGALAVIGDVPKTMVYRLCEHVNQRADYARIPTNIIEKPPSAELRPDQFDQDSLPPYDQLDAILELYVEREMNSAAIVAAGYEAEVVRRVTTLVDRSEFKRRQAPPVLKVTARAFGSGRRLPIAQRFRP